MNEASAALSKVCGGCGVRYPADALFCPLDGTPLQSATAAGREAEIDPYLGQEISGHIEIRQLVGIGAMGRVYRAFQKGIDRDVAVKILHRELSANAQLVSRFTREAKVASRLQHPNVVQVLLAGQLADRALYMVMEYLEGLSLQSALAAAGGALSLPQALHVVLQLCEATGEAHAVGIVHRDLKPENVMLVRRGTDPDYVKVLDFGIARINWGEQSVATAAGLIFGTARYISPEGAQGNAVGPASDVYAIATLFYQMLAGRTPFEGDQAVGLLVQQIHDPPPHIKSIARGAYVPGPLAEVIMANLAKDPAQRAQDARALGHAIIDAAKESGLAPDDISRPMLRRSVPPAMQLPPTEQTKKLDPTADVHPPAPARAVEPGANGHGPGASNRHDRPPTAATAQWEPPAEFQARLASAVGARSEQPPSSAGMAMAPVAGASRPRTPSGVDETINDASVDPLPPAVAATILTPAPAFPAPHRGGPGAAESAPRTMPGDVEQDADGPRPSTKYSPPLQERADDVGSAWPAVVAERSRARGPLFILLCFVLGAALAAGLAWKMGKLGGGDRDRDSERYVARATDAMYKNRFVAPVGDNVRDITDEGLKRWPNDHRLLDVRMRAANELVTQAMAQRSAGDVVEALRLARAAHELDPNDASAKRLVDQYEAELATSTSPAAPPLGHPAPAAPTAQGRPGTPHAAPPAASSSGVAVAYKVSLETNVAAPRVGQTVEFTALVAPARGNFEGAVFVISGPGLAAGATMPAQTPAPGVFKASFAFLEPGRFDVTFAGTADGKPLLAVRSLNAGDAPRPPEPTAKPPAPAPTGSVKWM